MNPETRLLCDELSVETFPIRPRETVDEWMYRYLFGFRRIHLWVGYGVWLAEAGMNVIGDSL
jgi:hypothetical protein